MWSTRIDPNNQNLLEMTHANAGMLLNCRPQAEREAEWWQLICVNINVVRDARVTCIAQYTPLYLPHLAFTYFLLLFVTSIVRISILDWDHSVCQRADDRRKKCDVNVIGNQRLTIGEYKRRSFFILFRLWYFKSVWQMHIIYALMRLWAHDGYTRAHSPPDDKTAQSVCYWNVCYCFLLALVCTGFYRRAAERMNKTILATQTGATWKDILRKIATVQWTDKRMQPFSSVPQKPNWRCTAFRLEFIIIIWFALVFPITLLLRCASFKLFHSFSQFIRGVGAFSITNAKCILASLFPATWDLFLYPLFCCDAIYLHKT